MCEFPGLIPKTIQKGIYGCGLLLSEKLTLDREKADREKADRERATVWELSEREKDIIKRLGKQKEE